MSRIELSYHIKEWDSLSPECREKLKSDVHILDENIHENFKILRVIYTLATMFGFKKLLDNIVPTFSTWDFPYILGALAIMFLAIRFLWAASNIRRYVRMCLIENIFHNTDSDGNAKRYPQEVALTRFQWTRIMLFDIPILLLHSFLIYIMCDILWLTTRFELAHNSHIFYFGLTVFLILVINAIWLLILKNTTTDSTPERGWAINNFIFAFLTAITTISWALDMSDDLLTYAFILLLIMVNSLIDFLKLGYIYIVGEPG